jgi:hypothetical protein
VECWPKLAIGHGYGALKVADFVWWLLAIFFMSRGFLGRIGWVGHKNLLVRSRFSWGKEDPNNEESSWNCYSINLSKKRQQRSHNIYLSRWDRFLLVKIF